MHILIGKTHKSSMAWMFRAYGTFKETVESVTREGRTAYAEWPVSNSAASLIFYNVTVTL